MATVKIIYRRKTNSQNLNPIVLRITNERKSKTITLGIYCQENEWDFAKDKFKKTHSNWKQRNRILLELENKALKIIDEMTLRGEVFTLEKFEQEFRGKKNSNVEFITDFFEEIIDEITRTGRIGSAKAFQDTLDSLIKFRGRKIKFLDVTPSFLDKYEVFLKENGNNNGGIAFKMRELRSILNKALKRRIIPKDLYPFEDYKISKLKSSTNKRALTLEEFKKLKMVDLSDHPHLIEAYNYFLFSIYARGMNFHDMMLLKWDDIRNGRIYYTRAKTKGNINLEVIPPLQEILDYYKAQNRSNQYVFPILLKEDLNPIQIANRKHKVLRRYNQKLKEIAQLTGINKNLSSYVARHSFATILKMTGTSIEKISEMMGHSNVSITIAYLKEFSNEDLDQENRKFIDL